MTSEKSLRRFVHDSFVQHGVVPASVEVRTFPGETIVIVQVERDYERALHVASLVDPKIDEGFITVRSTEGQTDTAYKAVTSVRDDAVAELINLLNARSRTSEAQPSIHYVPDATERIRVAVAPRHHLVFGRRGVGKTALLLEAQRRVQLEGAVTLWSNIQSLRELDRYGAFLTIVRRICDLALAELSHLDQRTTVQISLRQLLDRITNEQARGSFGATRVGAMLPDIQQALAHFAAQVGRPLFIFIDDVHYLRATEVPGFLDLLHGISRDNAVWLKVAGIKHQMQWFTPSPPVGLQTEHDAGVVDLDITLEEPAKAKNFLLSVLQGYVTAVGAAPRSKFLGGGALDRLVLASGGVPRDFLTLCASALQTARQRPNARAAGVQDVNNAAGRAAQIKLQELEEDAAAEKGKSKALVSCLNEIRSFLLSEKHVTFLRIDFLDKEQHPDEYSFVQSLMDLRMLHIINSSLSATHEAGKRSEVYLFDLSQYSGSRLKQKLRVLDFQKDHLVLKRTRSNEPPRRGDSARRLVTLLRSGPIFELHRLSSFLEDRTEDAKGT